MRKFIILAALPLFLVSVANAGPIGKFFGRSSRAVEKETVTRTLANKYLSTISAEEFKDELTDGFALLQQSKDPAKGVTIFKGNYEQGHTVEVTVSRGKYFRGQPIFEDKLFIKVESEGIDYKDVNFRDMKSKVPHTLYAEPWEFIVDLSSGVKSPADFESRIDEVSQALSKVLTEVNGNGHAVATYLSRKAVQKTALEGEVIRAHVVPQRALAHTSK
jgi:hypothetical protein